MPLPDAYPKYYGNREQIVGASECSSSNANLIDLQEFPIKRDGTAFVENDQQSTDRVVVGRIADGNNIIYAQCFIMTHEGATGNAFLKCE